jgi:Zn-dependent peptidase ImmA (M78 family)/transcriptional regulator with XRE-family HTH domain
MEEVTETMRDEHQTSIGGLIASLRERQGWSQRALARWVGIDQSAVSRIEAGRRRLSADELQRFADALHVSADELLGAAPKVYSVVSDDAAEEAAAPPPARASARAYALQAPPPDDAHLEHLVRPTPRHAFRSSVAGPAAPFGRSGLAGLPDEVAGVARDWFALRELAGVSEPAQRWSTGHSAEGKPGRVAHTAASPRRGAPDADVLYDRVARFWRSELHVDPDDGPLPDLVPLLEDGYGAQVIVARVAGATAPASSADTPSAAEVPVAAAFADGGVPFVFVNAARPVVLQRFALAHAFAHLVLGHGDVVDRHIEWSRNVPPEAAANDFAEELLAPVRAVQRWFERRDAPRSTGIDELLHLGNAFGISVWAALYRSRAAGRLQGKQFHLLRSELRRHEWELLPRQAYLGGLRDTLTHLTPDEALPAGGYGRPAVLRVPAPMRAWALSALRGGRLSLEGAAAMLHLESGELARQLARLGLE